MLRLNLIVLSNATTKRKQGVAGGIWGGGIDKCVHAISLQECRLGGWMERSVAPGRSRENRSKLAPINGACLMKGGCHAFYRNCGDGCYRCSCNAVWVEYMDQNYSARGYAPGWSMKWSNWSRWWCWCWWRESSKSLTSPSSPGQPGEGVEV